jgi:uncharacterized membrane protein YraQ (UPF0718 family)
VLALLLGGTALCITSIIMAWRVMRRKLAFHTVQNASHAKEDLIAEV